mmetsp:Transcript_30581/g.88846  ORF Transcript_30581/g.88846 Transcript_30581/m.88846 type:complete len:427 (-) Transcript_30581:165-1445(-)
MSRSCYVHGWRIVAAYLLLSVLGCSSSSLPGLPASPPTSSRQDGALRCGRLLRCGSSSAALQSFMRWPGLIDRDGFLVDTYEVVDGCEPRRGLFLRRKFMPIPARMRVRQVPGDGSCMFHSITATLAKVQNGTHHSMDIKVLREHSSWLRRVAVDLFEQEPSRTLLMEGVERITARDLLSTAADQYNIPPEVYCRQMRRTTEWGGGPEIVVLANILQRPIHIYELDVKPAPDSTSSAPEGSGASLTEAKQGTWRLRRIACFGSPQFDHAQGGPIHILSADSRFPDLRPGEQLQYGNHFLALFPAGVDGKELHSGTVSNSRSARRRHHSDVSESFPDKGRKDRDAAVPSKEVEFRGSGGCSGAGCDGTDISNGSPSHDRTTDSDPGSNDLLPGETTPNNKHHRRSPVALLSRAMGSWLGSGWAFKGA